MSEKNKKAQNHTDEKKKRDNSQQEEKFWDLEHRWALSVVGYKKVKEKSWAGWLRWSSEVCPLCPEG